jgi:hypothetical protein
MTEPYIVTGSYVVQREHALQDSPLDRALELMEGSALRFSWMRYLMKKLERATSRTSSACLSKHAMT